MERMCKNKLTVNHKKIKTSANFPKFDSKKQLALKLSLNFCVIFERALYRCVYSDSKLRILEQGKAVAAKLSKAKRIMCELNYCKSHHLQFYFVFFFHFHLL